MDESYAKLQQDIAALPDGPVRAALKAVADIHCPDQAGECDECTSLAEPGGGWAVWPCNTATALLATIKGVPRG